MNTNALLNYCQKMSMSYSYKPVLILALLNNEGKITTWDAASYFSAFYASRLESGLIAEKSNSIYSNLNCTIEQIRHNIISNPIKALTSSSSLFEYHSSQGVLEIIPSVWNQLSSEDINELIDVCMDRLNRYYSGIVSSAVPDVVLFEKPDKDNGYLSNSYLSEFRIMGRSFTSMSQYMAYRKAVLSGYETRSRHIMGITDTAELEDIYRNMKPSNIQAWEGQQQIIAYQGLISKFLQNEDLGHQLLNTGSSILGACLPMDSMWGIGLSQDDEKALNPQMWTGQNLLGFTLMQVRNSICSTRNL